MIFLVLVPLPGAVCDAPKSPRVNFTEKGRDDTIVEEYSAVAAYVGDGPSREMHVIVHDSSLPRGLNELRNAAKSWFARVVRDSTADVLCVTFQ